MKLLDLLKATSDKGDLVMYEIFIETEIGFFITEEVEIDKKERRINIITKGEPI